MTKRNIMLMLSLLLLPVMLMSIEFNLNNYQVPDHFEHGLKFRFINIGSFSDEEKVETTSHRGNLWAEYFAKKYSRENILSVTGTGGIGYKLYSKDYNDSLSTESKTPSFDADLELSANLRRYIIGEWFCNISGMFNGHESSSESKPESDIYNGEVDRDSYYYHESGEFGLGYGRVEDVSKACQAQEILSELEEAGLLQRSVVEEDVFELADLLVGLTTLRLFDYRLLKMEKVRQIEGELVKRELLADENIESFVIIMDLYNLVSVFERKSGWEIFSGYRIENYERHLEGDSYRTYLDTTTTYTDYENDYEENHFCRKYQTNMQFNYYQVLSNHWQLEVEGVYRYYQFDDDEDYTRIQGDLDDPDTTWTKREYEIEGYNLELDLNLSWYPDTRTQLRSGLGYRVSENDCDEIYNCIEEADNYENSYNIFIRNYTVYCGANYYFSPQLRASLNFSYSVDDGDDFYFSNPLYYYKTNDHRFIYSLYLTYYLF